MIAIKNGRIVLEDSILEGKVLLIEGDRILGFSDEVPEAERVIDAHGRYVTPGFIDIHSDKIEQFILPRPTAKFDFELALKECERELLHLGITTIYHSLSLYKDEMFGKSPLRTQENVRKIADLIRDIHERNHLIHHRFHLRLDIFGPIHSRRLGLSLGVNLLPTQSKLCSFDCIYCECGWKDRKSVV